jgi:hypothetical protein
MRMRVYNTNTTLAASWEQALLSNGPIMKSKPHFTVDFVEEFSLS